MGWSPIVQAKGRPQRPRYREVSLGKILDREAVLPTRFTKYGARAKRLVILG